MEIADAGDVRAVNPPLEEAIQDPTGLRLERPLQVLGSGLLIPPVRIEPPESREKGVVAEQPPQHVQDGRAFVVDERAEHPDVALDEAEPIAQMHRALIRIAQRPAAELPQHVHEGAVAARLLRVERREVLREAFTQPLLVVVLPSDRLSPPLVRELVGQKEFWEVFERRRVVAPRRVSHRQRVLDQRRSNPGCAHPANRFRCRATVVPTCTERRR